jgi:hypothetical protein
MAVNLDDLRWHDDARGISLTMNPEGLPHRRRIGNVVHGYQTLPGMLSVILAVVAGALGALVAAALNAPQIVAVAVGGIAFLLTFAALSIYGWRSISGYAKGLTPRFHQPSDCSPELCRP